MKKRLVPVLSFLLLVALTACGQNVQKESSSQTILREGFQDQSNTGSTSESMEQPLDEGSGEANPAGDTADETICENIFMDLTPKTQRELISLIEGSLIYEYNNERNILPDEYAPLPKGLEFPLPLSPDKFSVTYNQSTGEIVNVTIPINDDYIVIWVRILYEPEPYAGMEIVKAYNRNGRTPDEIPLPIRHRSDAMDLVKHYLNLSGYKTAIPGSFYYENEIYHLWEGGYGKLKGSGEMVFTPCIERKEWDPSKEEAYNRRYYAVYANTGRIELTTLGELGSILQEEF